MAGVQLAIIPCQFNFEHIDLGIMPVVQNHLIRLKFIFILFSDSTSVLSGLVDLSKSAVAFNVFDQEMEKVCSQKHTREQNQYSDIIPVIGNALAHSHCDKNWHQPSVDAELTLCLRLNVFHMCNGRRNYGE